MKEKWLKTQVVLSGSSMTRLFRKSQRVPVGRVLKLEVHSFSFLEFLNQTHLKPLRELILSAETLPEIEESFHQKLIEEVDNYLTVGGLPEVVTAFYREDRYQDIRRSLLLLQEEDFISKSGMESRKDFLQGLRGIANFLGGSSKYTHFSDSSRKGKEIISLLENWKMVFEVEQKGMSSNSSFYPKRYLYDLGIAQDLRNMPFPKLSFLKTANSALRTQLGGLLENMVFLQLKTHNLGNVDIAGWKESSQNDREVDFVLKSKVAIPIECKASLQVSPRTFTNVRRYLEKSSGNFGIVVSAAPYQVFKENKFVLINLPIYMARVDAIEKLAQSYI
jgi:predicted AAA+ superfamily ATPase